MPLDVQVCRRVDRCTSGGQCVVAQALHAAHLVSVRGPHGTVMTLVLRNVAAVDRWADDAPRVESEAARLALRRHERRVGRAEDARDVHVLARAE